MWPNEVARNSGKKVKGKFYKTVTSPAIIYIYICMLGVERERGNENESNRNVHAKMDV